MGHYASEMRSDADQDRLDRRDKAVTRALRCGFEHNTGLGNEGWICPLCYAIVPEMRVTDKLVLDFTDFHWKWHQDNDK